MRKVLSVAIAVLALAGCQQSPAHPTSYVNDEFFASEREIA